MIKQTNIRLEARLKRHRRIRKHVTGNENRPRLCVFRSAKHIYAQIVDDEKGETLASASSLSKSFLLKMKNGSNISAAKIVGSLIAEEALKKGIKDVVFDRGGYLYHGRVKALAESAREQGLVF